MKDLKAFPDKDELYQCSCCLGVFVAGRTKRDTNIDHEIIFEKEVKEEECTVVCDECFKKLLGFLKRKGVV